MEQGLPESFPGTHYSPDVVRPEEPRLELRSGARARSAAEGVPGVAWSTEPRLELHRSSGVARPTELPLPLESEYWGEEITQEPGEIQPMTLPRMRCSCGKVVPRMLDRYLEEFALDHNRKLAMNRALITNPCCRTQVVSPIVLPLGSGVSVVTRAGNNVEWRHSSMQQPRSIRQQIDLYVDRITGVESAAQQPMVSLQQAMEELYRQPPVLTSDVVEEVYSYTAR